MTKAASEAFSGAVTMPFAPSFRASIPSGRTPGLIISLITLLICVAGRYLFKKGIVKQDQKTEGVLGSIAYDIYGVVYALFIALLFIVPILCYLRQILVLIQS